MAQAAGRVQRRMLGWLDGQRGHLFPWAPVWLGGGIAWYFSLRSEPSTGLLLAAAGLALVLALLAWRWRAGWGPVLLMPALLLAGLVLAGERAARVAAPVIDGRFYGPVEGRVVEVDRSASGLLRLTLDRLVLGGLAPDETPRQVRISFGQPQPWLAPRPGQRVMTTAMLSPPEGPVIPGGFDFRRLAWFRGLGGIGFTQTPVVLLEEAPGFSLPLLRHSLAETIRDDLPGQSGAFAAAILTGDYSGLSQQTYQDLRASNLIHLISISGLHMVLLCGAVFSGVRFALLLVPGAAFRWPVRKLAAAASLAMGAFYYALSGGAIPAERAWVMIAVVFGAVLVDRRAISIRGLALAALVVLLLRPESLIDAGFQMSFAATLALVSGMEPALRRLSGRPGWMRICAGAVLSSLLAGLASAPFAAAHFNRFAAYGLLANLIAAPLMGVIVMPLCVVWMLAVPFGLGAPVLQLMGLGVDVVLGAGAFVAGLPQAEHRVPAPGALVLPLLCAGGLSLTLWQGRARALGAPVMLLSLFLWDQAPRPDLLVTASGALTGRMSTEGRALSQATGEGWAAGRWLEADADAADARAAEQRPGMHRAKGRAEFTLGGMEVLHLTGRGAGEVAAQTCDSADLLITTARLRRPGCVIWDQALLSRSGSVAIWAAPGGLRVLTANQAAGQRPWTGAAGRDAGLPLPASRREARAQ